MKIETYLLVLYIYTSTWIIGKLINAKCFFSIVGFIKKLNPILLKIEKYDHERKTSDNPVNFAGLNALVSEVMLPSPGVRRDRANYRRKNRRTT